MKYINILAVMLICFGAYAQNEKSDNKINASSNSKGFYSGVDLGLDLLKLRSQKNAIKTGLLFDAFAGYNLQLGKFILGIEGLLDLRTAAPKTTIDEKVCSLKRKYSFGIAPKIGYSIYQDVNGYVSFGTLTSKYKTKNGVEYFRPSRTSIFVGLGLEHNFGTMFVRGEVNRIFKKSITKNNNMNVSGDSYTFKIGGGYRF